MTALPSLAGRFDAIVIGASAGGVEVLSKLLPALPPAFPLPLLIVVHLPRAVPSLLIEVFSARCRLPVREATDKEPIEAGTIYFAPPDYHLLVERGPAIALSTEDLVHFSRPSIDVLFESAADVYGARVMGIILSGANRDGAAGLRAIGRARGTTVVQAPKTAHEPAMPSSALQAGPVDFILTPEELLKMLSQFENATC